MSEQNTLLRPREFSHQLLQALDASEGRRKRRKRDTTPDKIGLNVKRDLLQRVIEDDPAPEEFEGWLLTEVLRMPAGSGPVRALAIQILDEYHVACQDPHFRSWLAEGAPSADAVNKQS
ncbi:MAG: type III secretion fhipep protein [Chloroflexota bacterium]|nr:type III secretion fhipep protein [Chloroflexota bacterium]